MISINRFTQNLRFSLSDYLELRSAIRINNFHTFRTILMTAIVLFGIMFGVSFFSSADVANKNGLIYGGLIIFSAAAYGLSAVSVKRWPQTVSVWIYIFVFVIHVFGILVGCITQTTHPATTYIVMIFLVPTLFIDRPWRFATFGFCSGIVFLVISYRFKEYAVFFNDLLNFISFYILGIVCGRYFSAVKIQQLKVIKVVETERDTDNFTGVLTKTAFLREMDRLLRINNEKGVFLMIDVDNFKTFNDTYGHTFGDQVLSSIGDCMRNSFRQSDLLGRFGGDEFFVFIPSTNDTDVALFRAKSLQIHLAQEIKLPDSDKHVTLSIGISNCQGFGETYQSLFKRADEAIYEAKANGKDCIVIK